jgi:hypothetical protein
MSIHKKSRNWIVGSVLALALLACNQLSGAAAETPTPTANIAFEVIYETTWFCGNHQRVSFKLNNHGRATIESVFYSVTVSDSFVNYGTINNAPFELTTTESEPDCAQPVGHGQSSLAPGSGMSMPIVLNPIPAGETEGLLYIEACSEDNRGGECTNQTLDFNFTP